MALTEHLWDGDIHPIDLVESVAEYNDWDFDRIADDQRVTLGLTTRLLDKSSGQEKLRVSIAQSFYFRDRLIVLDTAPESLELELLKRDQSQIAMEIVARVNKKWHMASDIVYREASNLIEKTSLTARYNDRNKRLLNFTYRYTRRAARQYDGQLVEQSISQSNISAFLPISDDFNLVGRWNHDFTNDRELEVFAGFEYNNCCWRASLVAFRSLRRDDQLLFPEKELNARNGFAFVKFNFSHNGGTIENPIDFPDLKAFGNNTYGKEVADLVDGVTKISALEGKVTGNSKAENIRKLILEHTTNIKTIIKP